MRTIKQNASFKRDLKREAKGQYRIFLKQNFVKITEALAKDQSLERKYRDHAMIGDWRDHRNCHIRPDLVLIYRKPDAETLVLIRLGSHAELGL